MDTRQIAVKLTMDSLGLEFCIKYFQDRLILQKAIYLAQVAGVKLGYYHSWYLHGPYCSALASDGFAVKTELAEDELKSWKLDDESTEKLENLKPLFSEETTREKLARKLELLASVHFLIDRKQTPRNNTQKITEILARYNKDFKEPEVRGAMGELAKYGLLS